MRSNGVAPKVALEGAAGLQVDAVTKAFGGVVALRPCSFTVPARSARSSDRRAAARPPPSLPYVVRTVVAVYRGVGRDYEEDAAILGASRWQIFRHITLPLISSGIFSGMLFSILISLDNLSLSLFFTSAQTNTLPVVMLSYLQNQFDPAVAAIGTVQMLIAFVALLLIDRTVGLKHMTST